MIMRNEFSDWLKLICTLLFLCIFWYVGFTQNVKKPQFQSYTIKEGLPSNQVYATIQDERGMIWFATSNGLCQFDGQTFRVISDSSLNMHIKCALTDRNGLIWLGTQQNGLQRFDPINKTFKIYTHEPRDSNSISNDQILSLEEDQFGTIWVGTEAGLNRFDPSTETFRSYLPKAKNYGALRAKSILSILEDSKGRIWVGTWNRGLYLLDQNFPFPDNQTLSFRRFYRDERKPASLRGDKVWSILEDSQQRIWVGTFNDGLNLLDSSTLRIMGENEAEFYAFQHTIDQPSTISDNRILTMCEGGNHELWIGTIHGLNIIQLDTLAVIGKNDFGNNSHQFLRVSGIDNSSFHIAHDNVEHIFKDRDDILWIATAGGVSKYDPAQYPFESHLKGHLARNNIRGFAEIEDQIWLAAEGTGLIKYDLKTKESEYFSKRLSALVGIGINYIRQLISDGKFLWIAHQGGISRFNPKTEDIKTFILNLKDESGGIINFIASDIEIVRPDLFLIATDNGLVRFNPESGDYQQYLPKNDGSSIFTKDINSIKKGPKGNYWLGSYGSLMRMTILADDHLSFQTFYYDRDDPYSLGNTRVISLEATEADIWVGTEDGLYKYSTILDRFEKIEHDRLQTLIVSLIFAKDQKLWGSTRNGLFSIDLASEKINTFDVGLGLERNNFVLSSHFESKAGTLCFGTNDGFISFSPDKIKYNTTAPALIFTDFTVFGETLPMERDLNFMDEIKLHDDQNYFSISFAALNYHHSELNQYSFKMEGFDPEWRMLKEGNSVSYSNLSEGRYTFKIRGSNNNQVWNEEGAALNLVIIPPFWRTIWFRTLFFTLIICTGFLLYHNRVKWIEKRRRILKREVKERTEKIEVQKFRIEELNTELKKRNENLEMLVSERTKDLQEANEELRRSNNELEYFAYAASHDMREPIRMVGNFVQLLDKQYGDQLGENGKRYVQFAVDGVSRMSDLIQNLLEYATLDKVEMKFVKTNLDQVLRSKILDLQHLIKDKNGQVIIENLPEDVICEPEQLGMLFFNLINNGLKFNKNHQVWVKIGLLEENSECYKFYVEDNGIGIRKEDMDKIFAIFKRLNHRNEFSGTGIGLSICKRIVQKHNGIISLKSEIGKGTTFYFTISKQLAINNFK